MRRRRAPSAPRGRPAAPTELPPLLFAVARILGEVCLDLLALVHAVGLLFVPWRAATALPAVVRMNTVWRRRLVMMSFWVGVLELLCAPMWIVVHTLGLWRRPVYLAILRREVLVHGDLVEPEPLTDEEVSGAIVVDDDGAGRALTAVVNEQRRLLAAARLQCHAASGAFGRVVMDIVQVLFVLVTLPTWRTPSSLPKYWQSRTVLVRQAQQPATTTMVWPLLIALAALAIANVAVLVGGTGRTASEALDTVGFAYAMAAIFFASATWWPQNHEARRRSGAVPVDDDVESSDVVAGETLINVILDIVFAWILAVSACLTPWRAASMVRPLLSTASVHGLLTEPTFAQLHYTSATALETAIEQWKHVLTCAQGVFFAVIAVLSVGYAREIYELWRGDDGDAGTGAGGAAADLDDDPAAVMRRMARLRRRWEPWHRACVRIGMDAIYDAMHLPILAATVLAAPWRVFDVRDACYARGIFSGFPRRRVLRRQLVLSLLDLLTLLVIVIIVATVIRLPSLIRALRAARRSVAADREARRRSAERGDGGSENHIKQENEGNGDGDGHDDDIDDANEGDGRLGKKTKKEPRRRRGTSVPRRGEEGTETPNADDSDVDVKPTGNKLQRRAAARRRPVTMRSALLEHLSQEYNIESLEDAWESEWAQRERASATFDARVKREVERARAGAGSAAGTGAGEAGPLSGCTICLTGTLSKVRTQVHAKIKRMGGKVATSVTRSVTHLVVGPDGEGTTKYRNALYAGVEIVDESFLEF